MFVLRVRHRRAIAGLDLQITHPYPTNPMQKIAPQPIFPKGKAFWVGIGLMASSFGVFVLYLVIPFLSVSFEAKASIAVAGWAIAWGLFFIGTFLAGKDGYPYLKQLVRRRLRKS